MKIWHDLKSKLHQTTDIVRESIKIRNDTGNFFEVSQPNYSPHI